MSELMKARGNDRDFRWQLLTTVSALALLAAVYGTNKSEAADQDADRPTVWIELGGQLQRLNDSQEEFSPPFMASITQANLLSALNVQQPSANAIGAEGKISIQPTDSDWVFSASVQYGRSNVFKHRHQQTANKTVPVHFTLPSFGGAAVGPKYYYPTLHAKFADATAKQRETHGVIDFQAGKDVGLGMFGNRGSSVLSAGVRIAQFISKSNVSLHAEPDVRYPTAAINSKYEFNAFRYAHIHFHDFAATADAQRSFRGIGPSLAWNASAPFAGDSSRGEMSVDWSVNGAVLFGRQKASGHHKTTIRSYYETQWKKGFGQKGHITPGHFQNLAAHQGYGSYTAQPTAHRTNVASFNRMRTVIVPNIGAFTGVSYRIEDFKVAVGYRADFFFGAMDGGIDAAKRENIGFYGPFASVSVGLGG